MHMPSDQPPGAPAGPGARHAAAPTVQRLAPAAAAGRVRAGTISIVDVRPPEERQLAAIGLPHTGLEAGGLERLLGLPKDVPLAFLCHHGMRSQQAAEYFLGQGFRDVHNIVGGIEAWAAQVDPDVPRY